jgi:mRNA-degrading endonuclease RelE of RelBE toxin-antitoxin system
MASDRYEVRLTRQAEKDLKALRSGAARATRALLSLEEDPERGHSLTGSLVGARSLEFSMPGGAYRAAYVIREAKRRCIVFQIGAHEGFYKKAERRYRALQKTEPGEENASSADEATVAAESAEEIEEDGSSSPSP